MNLPIRRLALVTATLYSIALTGCTLGTNSAPATPINTTMGTIHGQVIGGNQPVVGSSIYVYAAATSAYGAASTLLSTIVPTTDSNGNFTITGDYTCTAGQQVYLYALGGNPGSGTNTGAGFLAILGTCPASGSMATVTPYVVINEVSTVAAAYAMSGFAVDATHVSDDEAAVGNTTAAIAKIGMANAFANAANLETLATGAALTTTGNNGAAITVNGAAKTVAIVVPQATINGIADILADCVNSTGATSSACTTLFGAATSTGLATGTQPTDTATAAINIAHYPAANVAILYGLIAASGTPFLPSFSAQPNDFTISILYAQGGTGTVGIAVDGVGNAYAAYGGGNTVYRMTPGAVQSILNVTAPRRLAIDVNNNVWVPSTASTTTSPNITEFIDGSSTSTATYYVYDTSGNKVPSIGGVAFDQNDYMWAMSTPTKPALGEVALLNYPVTNTQGNATVVVSIPTSGGSLAVSPTTGNLGITSGTTTGGALSIFTDGGAQVGASATYTGGGLYSPVGILGDVSGNFWIGNEASTSASTVNTVVSEFNGSTGASVPTSGYSITPPSGDVTSGLYSGDFDGLGNYFTGALTYTSGTTTPNLGGIYELNGSGTQLAVFVPPTGSNEFFAVDPSGNLWFGGTDEIGEMIGVAAPKVTPTVVANFPGLLTGTGTPGTGNKVATRP